MTQRKIVKIDQQKCDGCGQCVPHCAEGALRIVDGKARLLSDTYCDGLGACLGTCPQGAITIEEREAQRFDEEAARQGGKPSLASPCPPAVVPMPREGTPHGAAPPAPLCHWPIQLGLVPPAAPFLREAHLVLVADCVPLAMADFHARILCGRSVVMGCPKLDDREAYAEKLEAIFRQDALKSLTIARMSVPCCGMLSRIALSALQASGENVPVQEIVVGIDGRVKCS